MDRFLVGFILILIGFILVFLAVLLLSLPAGAEARGFGFILIGPIPIMLSGGVEAIYLLLIIAVALLVLIVAMLASIMGRASSP
ncbi:MAG: DUF131 domain-containing protein [Sulfolobales archaeon]